MNFWEVQCEGKDETPQNPWLLWTDVPGFLTLEECMYTGVQTWILICTWREENNCHGEDIVQQVQLRYAVAPRKLIKLAETGTFDFYSAGIWYHGPDTPLLWLNFFLIHPGIGCVITSNKTMSLSFHILTSSSFTSHPIIWSTYLQTTWLPPLPPHPIGQSNEEIWTLEMSQDKFYNST
jgi:hypothetical protein